MGRMGIMMCQMLDEDEYNSDEYNNRPLRTLRERTVLMQRHSPPSTRTYICGGIDPGLVDIRAMMTASQ